ncbi:MAG TPA: hypothetical protein VMV54_02180 [Acidocella sp.]|nr:hypothetical protein [Acidocella sp.]
MTIRTGKSGRYCRQLQLGSHHRREAEPLCPGYARFLAPRRYRLPPRLHPLVRR